MIATIMLKITSHQLHYLAYVVFGFAGILNVVSPCFAEEPASDETHGPFWGERAHGHVPDMSCCAPCVATEADRDPDVFKRPCFVRALAKSRKAMGTYGGLTGREGIKVTAERIPPLDIKGLQLLLETVMEPAYLPPTWEAVEFVAPVWRKKRWSKSGWESDLTADVKALKDWDPIQTAWAVQGIEVLPRTWHSTNPGKVASIRLRVHGDERLELGRRPENFTRSSKDFGAFFDRNAFHALLVKVFRVPFETPDAFLVDGYDTEYEGVRVFHGRIRSRDRVTQVREDQRSKPSHWWDEMRLLVTDSDPQYFCISVSLRGEAKSR